MNAILKDFRDFFVSLRLTVVLLILSIILVFAATLDQVNLGVWAVQEKYFRSFFIFWKIPGTQVPIPIFPGGYFVGGLLLINLVCAHIYRLQFTWKKVGIQLAHAGLILLLIGELITGLVQQESMMRLDEGETKNYSESPRSDELVVMDTTDPNYNEVVAVPTSVVEEKGVVQHPRLPFQLRILDYFPNAAVQMRQASSPPSVANQGIGPQVSLIPLPITYKPDERNMPAALVEVITPDGSIGTWLVSPLLGMPQKFVIADHTWEIALRFKRYYKPFSITLLDFSHDRYAGTDIPRNFSSRVRVRSDDGADDRESLIYMNNPLRYRGLTFYQAGFENNDKTTILQVVRNPGWLLPYIACVMMGLGLVIQFGLTLGRFTRRRRAAAA